MEFSDLSSRTRRWLLLWQQNTDISDRLLDLWHIQFDLIFYALLDRWQDPIQIYQFFDPILEVWKEWVEFLGGWLIFHSWNINHIFQSISMAVHSSYWSIKWYGGRGRFNQGLAAPPAKLPAILSSVLKGHEGEFSLQNNTILEISKSSPPFLPKLWIKQMKKISFCVSWTALDWQLHVSQLQWRTKGSLHHQHKKHKWKFPIKEKLLDTVSANENWWQLLRTHDKL